MKTNRIHRPAAIVLAATVGASIAVLAHAQALPASSAQAPGVIRPGTTSDEAGMTQRPTGIDVEFIDKAGMIGKVGGRPASSRSIARRTPT